MTLKKLQRLTKMSKSRHICKGYKFGIQLPNTIEKALQLDKECGTTYWYFATLKEMKNVEIAFEIQQNGKPPWLQTC
jgi:hypothetical protein